METLIHGDDPLDDSASGSDPECNESMIDRSIDNLTTDYISDVLSRHVKTAPNTPEVEARSFPRHAESTSQLSRSADSTSHLELSGPSTRRSNEKINELDRKSPNKEVSTPKLSKNRNDKFHRHFKSVPESEDALNAYSCAYIGDILLQGSLYISKNWFCFHSKILGHQKNIEIPVNQVKSIKLAKTALIIPNAISVRLKGDEKYVFGSLMSRDSTYKLMYRVWKQAVGDQEDLDIDLPVADVEDVSESLRSVKLDATSESDDYEDEMEDVCDKCGLIGRECPHTQSSSPKESTPSLNGSTSSVGDQRERRKNNVDYQKGVSSIVQLVTNVQRLPKTTLLLGFCTILVAFLILSAVILTYKILVLQAKIDSGAVIDEEAQYMSGEKDCDL